MCYNFIKLTKLIIKMSIREVEYEQDKVIVHYHLGKPDGVPNVDGVKEVPFDSIDKLPELPDRVGRGMNWREDISLPERDQKITFLFDSYQERSAGPNEQNIYGPFLERPSPPET